MFDGEDEEGKERLKAEVDKNASWKDKVRSLVRFFAVKIGADEKVVIIGVAWIDMRGQTRDMIFGGM